MLLWASYKLHVLAFESTGVLRGGLVTGFMLFRQHSGSAVVARNHLCTRMAQIQESAALLAAAANTTAARSGRVSQQVG